MDFVDDVDLVFALNRGVTDLVDKVANLLDTIIRSGVDFDDIRVRRGIHREAVFTMIALMPEAFFAVERLGKKAGHGRFSGAAGPTK